MQCIHYEQKCNHVTVNCFNLRVNTSISCTLCRNCCSLKLCQCPNTYGLHYRWRELRFFFIYYLVKHHWCSTQPRTINKEQSLSQTQQEFLNWDSNLKPSGWLPGLPTRSTRTVSSRQYPRLGLLQWEWSLIQTAVLT